MGEFPHPCPSDDLALLSLLYFKVVVVLNWLDFVISAVDYPPSVFIIPGFGSHGSKSSLLLTAELSISWKAALIRTSISVGVEVVGLTDLALLLKFLLVRTIFFFSLPGGTVCRDACSRPQPKPSSTLCLDFCFSRPYW